MEIEKIVRSCLDSTYLKYRYSGSCKFKKNYLNKNRFELLSYTTQPALLQYNVNTLMASLNKYFVIPSEIQSVIFEDSRANRPPPIIAVEERKNGTSLKLYSTYTEHFMEFVMLPDEPIIRPIPLYTGYKWKIDAPHKYELDTYTALPVKSRKSILDIIKDEPFFHKALEEAFKLSEGTMRELLFSEVAGLEGDRKSHDISFVNEKIPMKEMAGCTQYLCNYFDIKKEDAEDITEHLDGQFLTFIQGGIDNKGEEFLSYYYCEEDQLADNLQEIS